MEAVWPRLQMSMSVQLPRDPASVPLVRHLSTRSLSELGVVDEVVDDVEIALSEVCTNVVDHAEVGDSYEVEIFVWGHDCEIRVIDSGRGLDEPASFEKRAGPDYERGRGLAIVRAIMDRVGFESRADRGTLVTLAKHLQFEWEFERSE